MTFAMTEDKLKSLLSDLGRATLRGVRKCPKCGTYNGTRGLVCKNKACDVVFKEAGEKRKLSTEACKLNTGNQTQVYSVRVKDKGPDYRGFVQLPYQPVENEGALDKNLTIGTPTSALCFVETCQSSFDNTILKCHDKINPSSSTNCQHIQAAMRCFSEAQPLQLKNSVLTSLNVNEDIKEGLWCLVKESSGPVVQRVSKNIIAVKCKASPKHPLGYLHFSFFTTKLKDRIENKYFCSCTAFKGQVKIAYNNTKEDPTFKRCIHFFACVCAFVSDPKLSEEFLYYIQMEKPFMLFNSLPPPSPSSTILDDQQQYMAILNNVSETCEVEVEVLPEGILGSSGLAVNEVQSLEISEDGEITQISRLPNGTLTRVHGLEVSNDPSISVEDLQEAVEVHITQMAAAAAEAFPDILGETSVSSSLQLLQSNNKRKIQESNNSSNKKSYKKNISKNNSNEPVNENITSISYVEWLASVTERINQTMHYQFNGKPDPLVFHVPQVFFDCLRERISCGGRKKRMPNHITGFIRRDAVPLGTFTKYTWHITNIIHVKQIFETDLMPLEITKCFIQNKDGTFEPYVSGKDENEIFCKTNNSPLIRPVELKTFLKVGKTTPNQREPTPFIIEWIPDILPLSKIGELRIRFEYGHQQSGVTPIPSNGSSSLSRRSSRSGGSTRTLQCQLIPNPSQTLDDSLDLY